MSTRKKVSLRASSCTNDREPDCQYVILNEYVKIKNPARRSTRQHNKRTHREEVEHSSTLSRSSYSDDSDCSPSRSASVSESDKPQSDELPMCRSDQKGYIEYEPGLIVSGYLYRTLNKVWNTLRSPPRSRKRHREFANRVADILFSYKYEEIDVLHDILDMISTNKAAPEQFNKFRIGEAITDVHDALNTLGMDKQSDTQKQKQIIFTALTDVDLNKVDEDEDVIVLRKVVRNHTFLRSLNATYTNIAHQIAVNRIRLNR